MRHTFDIETLSRHIDKKCTTQVANRLESHLATCTTCRNDFVTLKNSVKALGNLQSIELSSDFDSRFNKRLEMAIIEKSTRFVPRPTLVKVFASIFIALLIGVGSLGYFRTLSPSLISAKGRVEIFDKKTYEWKAAKLGLKVSKGDIIRTAKNSQLDLVIPGMYSVRIKQSSELEVAHLTRKRIRGLASFNLKRGKALVDIEESFKGSVFKILTPTAEAKALGTKFVVEVAKGKEEEKTWVGVLDGEVEVKSVYEPPLYAMAKQTVVVEAGKTTEIHSDSLPLSPRRLLDKEWEKIKELYQIGRKPQVALLISTGANRVRELLRPCPIYISDEEPRVIPAALEEAIAIINKAIQDKDKAMHLEGIRKLEEIVEEHPDSRYNPQFLLFIGAYYNYMDLYIEAIEALQRVVDQYPGSGFAGLAQCTIGIIYDEGLEDSKRAIEAYNKVRQNYPNSPEISIAERKLGIQKVR